MSLKKTFLWFLVVVLIFGGVFAFYLIFLRNFGDLEKKLLLTILAFAGFSLTALASAIWYSKWHFTLVAYGGVICSAVGFLVALLGIIWKVNPWFSANETLTWKIFFSIIVMTLAFAHSSLLLLGYFKKAFINFVVSMTITCTFIASVVLVGLIISELKIEGAFLNFLGALGILMALGTLLTPLLIKTAKAR